MTSATSTTPTAANDNRPPEFDSSILAIAKRLDRLAARITNSRDEKEDLLQDTLLFALNKWRNFRGNHSDEGEIYNWLQINMRGFSNRRRSSQHSFDCNIDEAHPSATAGAPRQENIAQMNSVARLLSGCGGASLLLYAAGYSQREIGNRFGLTPERICQLIKAEREFILEAA